MGGSHSHSHANTDDVRTARIPRLVLLAVIAAASVATLIGLVALWPSGDSPKIEYAADGVTFPNATVVKVHDPCPVLTDDPAAPESDVDPATCNQIVVKVLSGEAKGTEQTTRAPTNIVKSGLQKGDTIKLIAIPPQGDAPATFEYFGTDRNAPIALLTIVFVVVVAIVARVRGLLSLVGLVFAGFVLAKFMLPALLQGASGFGVAVVGSTAIMIVVLYLAHGPSIRTSTALAGTLFGIAVTALLSLWSVSSARLSGMGDESGALLSTQAPDMNFQGLLTCAIIVAGLGVLNDVTITQSSAVWELRQAGPELSRRAIFTSGMRIGRDHIASTIYTIVFAYAGSALAVLLLLSMYDRPFLDVLTDESIAEEVLRTLASAIGLVLAVPATTAIAAATVSGPRPAA